MKPMRNAKYVFKIWEPVYKLIDYYVFWLALGLTYACYRDYPMFHSPDVWHGLRCKYCGTWKTFKKL